MTALDVLYYRFSKKIKVIPLLTYLPYHQEEVNELLERELNWTYYGGHHHESYYTRFFQSYYLPRRFHIDKRKLECSAMIRSGQMTRAAALQEITEHPYPYEEDLVNYTIHKLGLTRPEFEAICRQPLKTFQDYPTYYPLMKACKFPLRLAYRLNLFPKHLYLKYLG